nr:response regulator [Bacteroidota bacterium]
MNKLKILIVNNDAKVAGKLNRQLKMLGYTVTGIAKTCAETIEILKKEKPGLIVMDLGIRSIENSQSIESFLEVYIKGNIPVLFLSNKVDKALVAQTSAISPSTLFKNPVEAIDLHKAIVSLTGQTFPIADTENELHEKQRILATKRYGLKAGISDASFDRITQITGQFFNLPTS